MAARVRDPPDLDNHDSYSVSRLGSGGAPTNAATQQRMMSRFTGTERRMALGYGLTESSGVGTHDLGEMLEKHPNSVGRVLSSTEI